MRKIELVDLKGQYHRIKEEINAAIMEVLETTTFINGPAVKNFQHDFEKYLQGAHVVPCANGTDALQIAMMGLELEPGDEVITPSFTYAATAEVIALLKLKPVFVDADPQTFNLDTQQLEKVLTPKTKAIIPVHIFGQCANMEAVMEFAGKHGLFVIEDVAQAIGSDFHFSNGEVKKAGTIGHVGGTSFFPSKNLGCYGDGGAMISKDEKLAAKLKIIANHGQTALYYHDLVGVNSRLDSIQAAVLKIKLRHLEHYIDARRAAAAYFDEALGDLEQITVPFCAKNTRHVYHQYTLKVHGVNRDELLAFMHEQAIPARVYYPVPLHLQKAYNFNNYKPGDFPVAETLSTTVMSLPMHTELDETQLGYICEKVRAFCKR